MKRVFVILAGLILLLANPANAQLSKHIDSMLDWRDDKALLQSGEVFTNVRKEVHFGKKIARIQAAIIIPAPREIVWKVFNDCSRVASYVPHLKSCEVIKKDPKGQWEIRRHVSKFSPLLPKMVSEFKSQYTYPKKISFNKVGGNMDINQGFWQLDSIDGGKKTVLMYNAHVSSKSILPDKTVRKLMRKNTPKTMKAIRAEVMREMAKSPPK